MLILEPNLLLLPAVTKTRKDAMLTRLCILFEDRYDDFIEVFDGLKNACIKLTAACIAMNAEMWATSKDAFYARRRVARRVRMVNGGRIKC